MPRSSVLFDPSSVILSRGREASMFCTVIATGGVFCSGKK